MASYYVIVSVIPIGLAPAVIDPVYKQHSDWVHEDPKRLLSSHSTQSDTVLPAIPTQSDSGDIGLAPQIVFSYAYPKSLKAAVGIHVVDGSFPIILE